MPGCLSNGYSEHLLSVLGEEFVLRPGRNSESWEMAGGGHSLVVAQGFRNIQNHIRLVKQGRSKATFIEMMACPGACRKGNGFSRLDKEPAAARDARVQALARCTPARPEDWACAARIIATAKEWHTEYRSVPTTEVSSW